MVASRVGGPVGGRRVLLIDAENVISSGTTPGGGVEPTDSSVEAALRRELVEELGATITSVSQLRKSR